MNRTLSLLVVGLLGSALLGACASSSHVGSITKDTSGVTDTVPLVATNPDPPIATSTTDTPAAQLTVAATGFTTSTLLDKPRISAGVVIRNASSEVAQNVTVNINVKSASGEILSADTDQILYITPGTDAYATSDIFLDAGSPQPQTVEAQVRASQFADEPTIERFTVQNAKYTTSDYDGTMRGSITSGLRKDATNVKVTCATFDGGVVTGGFYTIVLLIPAGATTGFEGINGLTSGMKASEVRCYAALTITSVGGG